MIESQMGSSKPAPGLTFETRGSAMIDNSVLPAGAFRPGVATAATRPAALPPDRPV
jgi:hypothetical protein